MLKLKATRAPIDFSEVQSKIQDIFISGAIFATNPQSVMYPLYFGSKIKRL